MDIPIGLLLVELLLDYHGEGQWETLYSLTLGILHPLHSQG